MAKKAVTAAPVVSGEKKIDLGVLDVIKRGTWHYGALFGVGFNLPEQLDRKLYVRVIELLRQFGGEWSKKHKTIVFGDNEDAETSVREACKIGVYVDLQKAYQFFETPPNVSKIMMNRMFFDDPSGKFTVLEPSAGNGALIIAIAEACTAEGMDPHVTAIELDSARETRLAQLMGSEAQVLKHLIMGDFLSQIPELLGQFDFVVMNPPFAKSQDIKHVLHAYKFVKPGGTLLAVMSPGFRYRTDKTAELFRDWLEASGPPKFVETIDFPAGSFKSSGTAVNTVFLTIKKYK